VTAVKSVPRLTEVATPVNHGSLSDKRSRLKMQPDAAKSFPKKLWYRHMLEGNMIYDRIVLFFAF
jgi:hypothetical protein